LPKERARLWLRWFIVVVGFGILQGLPGQGLAGHILDMVRANGKVRVGVSEGLTGFSWKDAQGQWQGLDIDLARAVAAAVLEDPNKTTFVEVTSTNRFPVLLAGKIDLLLRNTTYTFNREAAMGILYAGVYFHDGQGFMVPAASPIQHLGDLNGATICFAQRTTHERNLADLLTSRGWTYTPVPADDLKELQDLFFSGKAQVMTADRGQLAAIRAQAPGGPEAFRLLPEVISEEPLGAVVRAGDDAWFLIVRWVIFALIEAEERGITQANARTILTTSTNPADKRFLISDGLSEKTLNLKPGWVLRVIEAVGNYGEIYERHLGKDSPLKLERGPNRLSKNGGLLYSPPFR